MRFAGMFGYITEGGDGPQGAVDRPEFEPDHEDGMDAEERVKMERFILRNTPSQHRYKTAGGQQGIVYFDDRGRAASAELATIPCADLVRIAKGCSKRFPGEVGHNRPETGRNDHGYEAPEEA